MSRGQTDRFNPHDRMYRLGVIDSLSAGYRLLGRRIEIVLIPILLDLLLWLAPQFSVGPLFAQLAAFYSSAAATPELSSDLGLMADQVAEQLQLLGEQINLLTLLVNSTLLHVPGLLATLGPVGAPLVAQVASWWQAIVLFCGFGSIGLLIGVIYLNLLAVHLPIGGATKAAGLGEFVQTVLRHWFTMMLFVVVVVVLGLSAGVPLSIGIGLLSLISPAVTVLSIPVMGGLMLLFFFYLYFVTAALIVDNLPIHRAIYQSFRLVRDNFWATLGFVILTNLISLGITLLLGRLVTVQPIGLLVAILINAYVGTGLAMALLVFYRTRILRAAGEQFDPEAV